MQSKGQSKPRTEGSLSRRRLSIRELVRLEIPRDACVLDIGSSTGLSILVTAEAGANK
jgi:hypothetical protein